MTLFGIAAAKAAGMRALGFAATTPAERLSDADAVFATMKEPPQLLRAPAMSLRLPIRLSERQNKCER
jgi:beta-phosphoglucomutase-like phosphatase (HAD superfamily)